MQTIHKTRFSKLKNNVYAFMLASGSCALLFLLLFAPKAGLDGARNGLTLCAEVVIPTLFPFLVLSAFMIKIGLADRFGRWLTPVTRFLFHLPGAAAPAIILGVLGGYPVGAKACADLVEQGSLNKEQGNRLLSFSINSSPAYIIGAVGTGLLESAEAGILLYAAHILSSLIIGIFLGRLHHTKKDATPPTPRLMNTTGIAGSLVSSVTGAASSMVGICAFVVFFSSISSLISFTGIVENTAQIISHFPLMGWFDGTSGMTFVKGFLEVSGGCEAASKYGLFVLETLSA
ncbi:MAG TPA: hypothetical protein DEP42_05630, partial [Ruminococcaceae bacterium]|nr:hypothetical protein [Oscillospiraceae bacterium]